ncbi:uncharacterized protein LTR77_000430 [Saxophila tyrrhenica]|uniref:Uncharacterized protein n=1 Tax=Saxophila tyrrhenica TaxID=1690608 RepID=A0AAV9PN94_9PEZI|nr:hypothetical protein LTR77_000430 [Saxophila tyrrhenica]
METADENDGIQSFPDGGFAMDFSVEIEEDVPALVEEMMRLGTLGYFVEARKLSDKHLVRHASIFAVAAERMRLLLIQGDISQLAKMSYETEGAEFDLQRAIVNTMFLIANVHISPAALRSKYELSSSIERLENLSLRDDVDEAELLLKSVLELHRSNPTCNMQDEHQRFPLLQISFEQHRRLMNIAQRLVQSRHYWEAKPALAICCRSSCSYGLSDNGATPALAYNFLQLAEIAESCDQTTFEGRSAAIDMSQTICDAARGCVYYDKRGEVFPPTKAAITRLLRFQNNILERAAPTEDYGPRCHARLISIATNLRAMESLSPGGMPLSRWDIEGAVEALNSAKEHEDLLLSRSAERTLTWSSERKAFEYLLYAYSNHAVTMQAPHVKVNLLPWPYAAPAVAPGADNMRQDPRSLSKELYLVQEQSSSEKTTTSSRDSKKMRLA